MNYFQYRICNKMIKKDIISAIYKAKYLIIYRYAKGVEILGNSAIAWIHNKFLKIFAERRN